jgi:hypothetical protein
MNQCVVYTFNVSIVGSLESAVHIAILISCSRSVVNNSCKLCNDLIVSARDVSQLCTFASIICRVCKHFT